MSTFFAGQNAVKFRLTGLGNLTDASECYIKYKTPAGVLGQWAATIEDITTGIIFYNMIDTEILTEGQWTFWAYVVYSDDRVGIGETSRIIIKPEGGS